MPRKEGNTPHGSRRHHKAMKSGSHGGGCDAKIRAAKKKRGSPASKPARKSKRTPEE